MTDTNGRERDRCDRCREPAGERRDGPTAPATTRVPPEADRTVFEIESIDCLGCPGRIEEALESIDGVYAATASYGTATVGIRYDASTVTADTLETRLATAGHPVESRDSAFRNRQARHWADARVAAGVMAGLMTAVSYATVIYPARHEWLLGSAVAEHLRAGLGMTGGFGFYLNIAVLSGIVLFFAGGPMLDHGWADLRSGTATPELAAAGLAVPAYLHGVAVVLGGPIGVVDLAARSLPVRFDIVVATVLVWLSLRHALGLDAASTTGSISTPDPDGSRSRRDCGGANENEATRTEPTAET
ncbi:cation transporter [Halopenitus sp. H-Gu1]|uniref:cation transporter n=1 Tax=Halopenitus sp. H-Gu1 TaxID=3242697 RepID=UPI00359EADC0